MLMCSSNSNTAWLTSSSSGATSRSHTHRKALGRTTTSLLLPTLAADATLFRAKRINHCNDFVARVALEVVDSSWWKQQLRVKSAGSSTASLSSNKEGIAVVITHCHAVLVPTALSAAVALVSARSSRSVGSFQCGKDHVQPSVTGLGPRHSHRTACV
jgi:hypothetical protein